MTTSSCLRHVCAAAIVAIAAAAASAPAAVAAKKTKTGSFPQVGHEPLMERGMNAALAVNGDYVYVGSRTDGGHEDMPHGGIMVVDASNPSAPELLGPPLYPKPGESTRELRVWRSQDVLIVLNTNCGVGDQLHHCALRGGALSCPFSVWDISPVLDGQAPVTLFNGLHGYTRFPPAPAPVIKPTGGLHSLTVSNDGTRAYFALLTGGFAVVDTSDFAAGTPAPQLRLITLNERRPVWAGPGAHSAVKLWGRDWVWVSDEVYGTATGAGHGCPWGWARMIDIADPTTPVVEAEYRIAENDPATCATWNPPRTSYSAHNPTLTPHIAFSTWHSGGLQAVSLEDPREPYQPAEFTPKPLGPVLLQDPRLSSDPDTRRHEKVVMWSYPVIQDGLIYVVDLRNGLYVLRYHGAFEKEVARISFLEGNSNQGDALCYEPVGSAPEHCE